MFHFAVAAPWLCLGVLLVCGCGDAPPPDSSRPDDRWLTPPKYWDPGNTPPPGCAYGYGEACNAPQVDCDKDPCIHGTCVDAADATTEDACACNPGYAGALCDACASGFTPQGLECVAIDVCQNVVCVYGTCRPSDGVAVCICNTGYAGAKCDRCAEGYHAEALACVRD
jgi:hypothetical protein